MSERPCVLVIDDHRMFTDALGLVLRTDQSVDLIGAVQTAEEAIQACKTKRPDIVLMDIDLPGMDGIEATRQLLQADPELRVIVVTAFHGKEMVTRAIEAGASGFVPKNHAADELVQVIRRVASGEMVVVTSDLPSVMATLHGKRQRQAEVDLLVDQLTSREVQVLKCVAQGLSTADIASTLGISRLTVRGHIKTIFSKLGVHSRGEATALALSHGLVGGSSYPGGPEY